MLEIRVIIKIFSHTWYHASIVTDLNRDEAKKTSFLKKNFTLFLLKFDLGQLKAEFQKQIMHLFPATLGSHKVSLIRSMSKKIEVLKVSQ